MIVKARLEAGVVVEAFLLDEVPDHLASWTTAPIEVGPGWRLEGETWIAPDPYAAIRDTLSLTFAQMIIGLVTEAWITEAEGDAWLAGTLPSAVLSLISTLPAGEQFAARARAVRPSVVLRTDPLVQSLGAANGKTPAEMDEFFVTYAV